MRIPLTLAAGLLALVAITAASGHAQPVRFDPAPGQVLDTPPQRVDGWFTQQMRRSGEETSLAVHPIVSGSMLGDPVSAETVIDDSDRRHMYAELTGDLMPGQYVVSWSALSDEDDHADSGCYRFFVGQEAADAAAQSAARLDAAEECATLGVDGMDGGTPTASGPSISISAPDVIKNRDVTVGLKAAGVEIRLPTNEGQDPKFGHYHLYLDIPPNVTHSHNGTAGTPTNANDIMTTTDSHTFKGLKPGNHVVTAVLFYDDHTPFSPAVLAGTSFTVPGNDGGGDGIDTGAAIGLAIGIGAAGLIAGGMLGFALRRRAR